MPQDVDKISFCVTIHEAETRRQSFGMVSNAFIRIVNDLTGREIARWFVEKHDYFPPMMLNAF